MTASAMPAHFSLPVDVANYRIADEEKAHHASRK
jgi:hypothetical protein